MNCSASLDDVRNNRKHRGIEPVLKTASAVLRLASPAIRWLVLVALCDPLVENQNRGHQTRGWSVHGVIRIMMVVRIRSLSFSTLLAVGVLTTVGIAQVDNNKEPKQIQASSPRTGLAALPALAQARISAAIGEDERAYHLLERSRVLRMD